MTGKLESHITTRDTGNCTRAEHTCVRGENTVIHVANVGYELRTSESISLVIVVINVKVFFYAM